MSLDTYLDALQHFPDNTDTLQVAPWQCLPGKKRYFQEPDVVYPARQQ